MELTNEFRVSVPVDEAWSVLTDLERIAPCMPGAELQEVEGDEYRGVVKIKVGPITAQYKGRASFQSLDPGAHKAVLKAEGRDTRGQGNASATVTAELESQGDGTSVRITTDLNVTGKVAQFGRGVLADVSAKLLAQFVSQLETDVLSGASGSSGSASGSSGPGPSPAVPGAAVAAAPAVPASARATGATLAPESNGAAQAASPESDTPAAEPASAVRTIQSRPAEPVNLLEAAGGSVTKRLVPVGLGFVVLLILWRVLRKG
jgi:uncharacterized protein